MIKLLSKMENTFFDEILIKKGVNLLDEEDLKELMQFNLPFIKALNLGFLTIKEPTEEVHNELEQEADDVPNDEAEEVDNNNSIDFDSMTYQQLLKYVKINNISFTSKNKNSLLKAIKKSL